MDGRNALPGAAPDGNRGLIKSRWGESETGRKRKYYSLKKDGKTAMAKHHEQWSLVHSVLAGLQKEQYV